MESTQPDFQCDATGLAGRAQFSRQDFAKRAYISCNPSKLYCGHSVYSSVVSRVNGILLPWFRKYGELSRKRPRLVFDKVVAYGRWSYTRSGRNKRVDCSIGPKKTRIPSNLRNELAQKNALLYSWCMVEVFIALDVLRIEHLFIHHCTRDIVHEHEQIGFFEICTLCT